MLRAMGLLTAAAGLTLTPGASAQDAPKPKAKLICKRSADTGSLIAKRRECRTREEWDRIAQAANENVRYEMERNMNKPGGQ